jgi:multiple sugar transport system substrate-binding protein
LSYNYDDKQWALAIDAATPAASYRKDLLAKHKADLPADWQQVLALAKAGRVAVPAIPIDLLMNFYTFCIVQGRQPFLNEQEIVDADTAISAIEMMRELYELVDRKMFQSNPIAVAEMMTATDQYWYCPFAYAYSNYSREGYAENLLHYTDTISISGTKLKTTIGGTGLAVSAFSAHKELALDFASMAVSPRCQRTLYVQHGGQPGHRSAWEDEEANGLTNGFFKAVLPVMDHGYVRPRYNGYLHFQDQAGIPLQQCLLGKENAAAALKEMNKLYRQSIIKERSIIEV